MSYAVLAYYLFPETPVQDPKGEVVSHKALLASLDGKGRIYISEQGYNAQVSVPESSLDRYLEALKAHPMLCLADIKIHTYHSHAFAKLIVRYKRQLVAIDRPVNMALKGPHLSPDEWAARLRDGKEKIIIDVRNDYEWKVGHFEGSELPPLATFREFPEYARKLKERVDPEKTEILMCCTGGIRCEIYSALMKEEGFKEVYQLQGGIIGYGLRHGDEHWKGNLFVFDDRLVVPIAGKRAEPISECLHCKAPADTYYNCANTDCNELFIACAPCAEKMKGCCQESCMTAPRLRLFDPSLNARPYRKLRADQSEG